MSPGCGILRLPSAIAPPCIPMSTDIRQSSASSHLPGFMVLHGNRLEDLRTLLIGFLKSQPLAVLQPEVILVQSNGMKNWLEMALADEDALGICAATRMELPGGYLWQVYRAVLGADAVPHHMVFDKANLLWRLMRLLPTLAAANPVYAPLQRYLGAGAEGRRLYQLAQQIADVFDGYQSYRADWLGDWAAGQDILGAHDGQAQALDDTQRWQAQLWRDVCADVGASLADASRSSVHARFMAEMKKLVQRYQANGQVPAGVPPRIVVFGISSLSMQTVEALAILGQMCQVLMLVQNPCQYFWGDIVEGHAQLRQQLRQRQQAKPQRDGSRQGRLFDEAPAHAVGHPLLASWGKQGRDYLHQLNEFDQVEAYRGRVSRVDAFVDPVVGLAQPSQLAQLQSAILNLEPLPAQAVPLSPSDRSIVLASTHSAQRELEVLHDALLAWFDADAELQARDVMVMVPDMESFAPHIHAVFGRFARGLPRHIPYSVADTTARQSPMVQALEQLLQLPESHISLLDWLSLFEVSAVRHRFGLTPADITQLQEWLSSAGVRWGLDASHRQRWGIPDTSPGADQNTWAFGLRRLLLGYAVAEGACWAATLPQAAIRSLDGALISHLLEWVEAISATLQVLSSAQTPQQWCATLGALVERFFLAEDDADERMVQRLLEPLEVWLRACTEAQLETPLALDVVREHWLSQIADVGLTQRFFGGGVQFGTLMPMRSIPFKVVCLLGMNDGAYPRQSAPRDFDLMAQSWRAGDRSRREDDRYLFLEAILSARERLYISWQGHSASDNAEQPPSVLVAQLIDYLHSGWSPARAVDQQPLQAYSEVYFLQGSAFQTFDQEWARLHGLADADSNALAGHAAAAPNPAPPLALRLEDMRQLLRQPVEVFFCARLHIRYEDLQAPVPDLEPFSLNGLEKYQVGQALLKASDAQRGLQALKLSGRLPMAAFGDRLQATFERELALVLERRTGWREKFTEASPALAISLNVDGHTITGTLNDLWRSRRPGAPAAADTDADAEYVYLQLGQRLGAVLEGSKDERVARGHIVAGLWVNHVIACASGWQLTSVQLGLDGQVVFQPLAPDQALNIVRDWLRAYHAAWAQALPVACKTAWAYLQAKAKAQRLLAEQPDKPEKQKNPHDAAEAVFEDGFQAAGERSASPYLSRAFDSYQDIEADLAHWAEVIYGAMASHAAGSDADAQEQDA